jgi:hypothetical protein
MQEELKSMELDRDNLSDVFDMNEIESEVDRLTLVSESDPEEALKENIDRANRILDRVEQELENGNFTARMVEVAGNILSNVTNSSKELIANINYKKYLQIREKMVKYKYDELEAKKQKFRSPTSQNIILSNREDIMKLISGEVKQIETTK